MLKALDVITSFSICRCYYQDVIMVDVIATKCFNILYGRCHCPCGRWNSHCRVGVFCSRCKLTTNLSILLPNSSLVSNDTYLWWPSLILINGVDDDCPANCMSNFSLGSILLAVSTACLRSSIGNSIQYNLVGSVFLNTSKICGSL